LVAGYAVPTQRTFYVLAVVAATLWPGRTVSFSLVLCWALLAVVVIDPWAVLAPGFWLSFGAVALLGYAGSNRLVRPGWFHETAHAQWVVALGLMPLPDHHPLSGFVPKRLSCFAGQSWVLNGVRFDMLHPTRESYSAEILKDNDRSCVLKVSSLYGILLLTGDI
jgi:Competence protein